MRDRKVHLYYNFVWTGKLIMRLNLRNALSLLFTGNAILNKVLSIYNGQLQG